MTLFYWLFKNYEFDNCVKYKIKEKEIKLLLLLIKQSINPIKIYFL